MIRSLRHLILPLLLIVGLSVQQAYAQQQCFTLNDGDSVMQLGDVMIGGVVDVEVVVTSEGGLITVALDYLDTLSRSHARKISPSNDSIVLQSGTSATVRIRIDSIPPGATLFSVLFREVTTCDSTDTLRVQVNGIDTTSTSIFLPLEPGTKQTYAARTENQVSSHALKIRNTTSSTIRIDSILSMDDSIVLDLKHPPLPIMIPAQETLIVSFLFIADTAGFHRSGVRLPNNTGLASEYSVQVIRLEKAIQSVPPIVSGSGIRVSQSMSEIAVEGLPFDRGMLTIFDLLGRPVRHHEITTSSFIIEKKDDDGQPLSDGCYLLNVRDRNGRTSESIKLLLLSY